MRIRINRTYLPSYGCMDIIVMQGIELLRAKEGN
jgi:hypothetical protein